MNAMKYKSLENASDQIKEEILEAIFKNQLEPNHYQYLPNNTKEFDTNQFIDWLAAAPENFHISFKNIYQNIFVCALSEGNIIDLELLLALVDEVPELILSSKYLRGVLLDTSIEKWEPSIWLEAFIQCFKEQVLQDDFDPIVIEEQYIQDIQIYNYTARIFLFMKKDPSKAWGYFKQLDEKDWECDEKLLPYFKSYLTITLYYLTLDDFWKKQIRIDFSYIKKNWIQELLRECLEQPFFEKEKLGYLNALSSKSQESLRFQSPDLPFIFQEFLAQKIKEGKIDEAQKIVHDLVNTLFRFIEDYKGIETMPGIGIRKILDHSQHLEKRVRAQNEDEPMKESPMTKNDFIRDRSN